MSKYDERAGRAPQPQDEINTRAAEALGRLRGVLEAGSWQEFLGQVIEQFNSQAAGEIKRKPWSDLGNNLAILRLNFLSCSGIFRRSVRFKRRA